MALRAGEIDAAYGMPYASYPLFQNEDYSFSSCATSRAFFLDMNFKSSVTSDPAVRRAIAMGVDKERFVSELLDGNGYVAEGVYPDNFTFGGDAVSARDYDPEGAKAVLEAAGWVDADGDGIREKDGQKLTIRWLTYPSRQELPLLAESAQATLKDIGIEVIINCTADVHSYRTDPTAWDVYASAMVTAPTGDPEYFFATHCLDDSPANNGGYHSDKLEGLAAELAAEFDPERRAELAVEMQQIILDDDAFVFCSHLQMTMISKSSVTGLTAHPCDFYEISAELAPAA
jgi:peptide/nickel transport system substrate-binding protein